MAPMYILARDIDDRKTTAAMRLRLIRTYDIVQSRYSDRVRSRECVFHDEEGSYVHLNIPGNNVSAANSFIEGHVYCLKNFLVISPIYTYRTCSSDFMLQYYHKTLVKQYKGLDFPRKMFRLQPFDSIKSLEGIDPKVLIAEELKAMQPKVPTRIPKEIVSLVGRGMLFKINVERDRLEKRNLAFPVMQIKDDIAVVNEYCPGMLKEAKQKSTNSEEPLDDEFDSDEGFFSDEEAESPLPNPLSQVAKGCSNDSEAVKRRLLDELSSTQVSKKKTHLVQIKVEKDSGLAVDQNSQNIEI
nr:replication protein A 70 kDa DNA-binding subunit B-like [Ipomoea batatas]